MRIAFGICSWGLGHATRTLPIIRKFIDEGDEVAVVSHGNALNLLKNELREAAEYVDLEDYHPPETQNAKLLAFNTFLRFPEYLNAMRREHRFVEKLLVREKVDAIFSDNRFGFYSLRVPSFFMTHQLRIMNPLHLRSLESGTEILNRWLLDRLAGVIVPDFRENGLAGKLAHGLSVIDEDDLSYIGALSDFRQRELTQDIDLFVSISGIEPQRTAFEGIVMKQLEDFDGSAVVSLGRPAESGAGNKVKVQGISPKAKQEELLNRARIVIARSGYSTLMDLCILGKKALLVPTPGQTEQEYLAEFHMGQGGYFCVRQRELDIPNQLDEVLSRSPPRPQYPTERAVENAVGVITGTALVE